MQQRSPDISYAFKRATTKSILVYLVLLLLLVSGMHESLEAPWLLINKYVATIVAAVILLVWSKHVVIPPVAAGILLMALWLATVGFLRDQFYTKELIRLIAFGFLIITVWSFPLSKTGVVRLILCLSIVELFAMAMNGELNGSIDILKIGGGGTCRLRQHLRVFLLS